MATVMCPECGKETSDNTSKCSHCGNDLRKHYKSPNERQNIFLKGCLAIPIVLLIVL